jgi:putative transposase
MINFKGNHYPKDVIPYAVFFYVRYAVSYRDLEEIMAERSVEVDQATLNRWVIKFSPLITSEAQRRKSATSHSWRMPSHAFTMRCQVTDETYIKVKGK